jgi:hypothetical protein
MDRLIYRLVVTIVDICNILNIDVIVFAAKLGRTRRLKSILGPVTGDLVVYSQMRNRSQHATIIKLEPTCRRQTPGDVLDLSYMEGIRRALNADCPIVSFIYMILLVRIPNQLTGMVLVVPKRFDISDRPL